MMVVGVLLRYYEINLFGLYGLPLSLLFLSISYFVLTIVLLNKYGGSLSKFGIILSIILAFIDIPLHIIDFRETLISFPELLSRLLAVCLGYLYFSLKTTSRKVVLFIVSISFFLSFSIWGYSYYGNYLNFGTITGKVNQKTDKDNIMFQTMSGDSVGLFDLCEEYLLFDMWSTGCHACLWAFPHVQTIYDMYAEDDVLGIYSIFCHKGDKGETAATGNNILAERGFSFPMLSINIDDPILKTLGVNGFPNILIFDSSRNLIFRGNILMAEKFIEKQLNKNSKNSLSE
jgi:thiol-disulfide isomerase/thioredoxin